MKRTTRSNLVPLNYSAEASLREKISMLSVVHALRRQKSAVTLKQMDLPTAVSQWGNCLGKSKSQRDDLMMPDTNCSCYSAEASLREKFFLNAEDGTCT